MIITISLRIAIMQMFSESTTSLTNVFLKLHVLRPYTAASSTKLYFWIIYSTKKVKEIVFEGLWKKI